MTQTSRKIISDLRNDKRFRATCPVCEEDFQLADATLFVLDDQPPEAALQAIAEARRQIKGRRQELAAMRERMTTRAQKTAHAVNVGKIIEKIAPSFSTFSYSPGDCRALFEPIDYLVFSGLTKNASVDALYFIDVKSGKARLNEIQRSIKQRVETKAVSFRTTTV